MTRLNRRTLLKAAGLQAGAWAVSRPGLAHSLLAGSNPAKTPITQQLAEFVRRVRYEDLPANVILKAKEQIVYHLGLAFGGIRTQESEQALAVIRPLALPRGAAVIGERFRLSLSDAAFYNTTVMRALWRDDVTWPTGIHAGIITLPPGLAVGELRHSSGRELLVAYVLGYEVMCKLARVADPWSTPQPRRPTMVYGAFGPITVAGRLMQLDEERLANAYGYAANLTMGVPQGGQTEHFYGLLCRYATCAAQFAEAGGAPYTPYTIEGATGLYRSFFGMVPPTVAQEIRALGSDWEILTAAQKRYPGTGQNTVATEVFRGLLAAEHLRTEDVARIDVYTGFASESIERKRELASRGPFKDWVDAWASLPYALAVVLVYGAMNTTRYQANLQDPRVDAAMSLVHLHTEAAHAAPRYARVEVITRNGRKISRDADNAVFPFPPEAWGPWLQEDGRHFLPLEQLQRIERSIAELENVPDVSLLAAQLVPRARSRG
ncbi:MAG: MmgE/PrpD family protein [Steroidobacteraceae bacterium]